MYRLRAPLFLVAFSIVAFIPDSVFAATTNFFGPIVDQSIINCGGPAGWGGLLLTINNLVNFAISFGIIITVLMAAYAGFLWVLNPTNPENRSTGRNLLINAVIGLIITLAAWLIINTLLNVLGAGGIASKTGVLGAGNSGPCITATTPTSNVVGGSGSGSGSGASGGSAGPSGVGTCQPATNGPCAPSNLPSFGGNASNASEICNAESGGNPQNQSRSDKTSDGNSYSIGLFQINITNSYPIQVDGQKCDAAFSNACQGASNVVQSGSGAGQCNATVVNQRLYTDCVASAMNPDNNIAAAVQLSNGGTSWGRWSTAKTCGL